MSKSLYYWHDMDKVDINRLVPYYLMSCYLYYELDLNVIEDYEFENICKKLLLKYDLIKHYHKYLLDKDALSASTGYGIKYPTIVISAAKLWYGRRLKYRR